MNHAITEKGIPHQIRTSQKGVSDRASYLSYKPQSNLQMTKAKGQITPPLHIQSSDTKYLGYFILSETQAPENYVSNLEAAFS
jgi:hypothetical protein